MACCKMLFQQIKEKAVIQPELVGHLLCSVLAASVCLSHNTVNTAKGEQQPYNKATEKLSLPRTKTWKTRLLFYIYFLDWVKQKLLRSVKYHLRVWEGPWHRTLWATEPGKGLGALSPPDPGKTITVVLKVTMEVEGICVAIRVSFSEVLSNHRCSKWDMFCRRLLRTTG